ILVIGFVSTSIFVVESLRRDSDIKITTLADEVSFESDELNANNNVSNPQPYVQITNVNGQSSDVADSDQSDVLGVGGTGCEDQNVQGCKSDVIAFQPVCTEVTARIDLRGGQEAGNNGETVTVNKNSKIEIWKVTAPLAVL